MVKYGIKTPFKIIHMQGDNIPQKGSYEKAMKILKAAMERRYEVLTETFIKEGPDKLKTMMGFEDESDWEELFDYLVARKGVLKKTVMNYMDFFSGLVEDKGPQAMRKIFRIEKEKYDDDFEEIFDLAAISTGAIYNFVKANRVELAGRVKRGEARLLRVELGIKNRKYDGLWFEILDLLMNAVCDGYSTERDIENGLTALCSLMNKTRAQRSIRSYAKMWEYAGAEQ